MKDFIKRATEKLIFMFPMKNIIVLESLPDFSDNTRAIFDEMVNRGINKKYRLVWATHGEATVPDDIKAADGNIVAVNMDSFLYKYYYSYFAKAIIAGNYFLQRRRKEQYYLYAAHGAAFKAIKDRRYSVPKDCYGCDFAVYSDYIGEYDIRNLNGEGKVQAVELGFARNDALFDAKIDVSALFEQYRFRQLIYWMPTFRQKADSINEAKQYTSIAVPFIYDKTAAEKINACAAENGILLVLKPHPAQDMSFIKDYSLSNLVIIDNDYLKEHGITNYQLLGASDALLTDYSSVYYDYLLCDRPIGLCWEDFEEYNESEGFTLDPAVVMAGGEKLYTPEDLCAFIRAVAAGEDSLQRERAAIRDRIHKYTDAQSARRTVDHIMKHLT